MTRILKWALVLCLALSFISHSKAQTVDSTTGNLINTGTAPTDTTSTWNNGVYVNTICFQSGQPGNCGPKPSVRAASGDINFSYGQIDLNQVVNINRALAAGGTGVQLSGFNFGFRAKNGNGWDDGRQDYLDAYVKFYNAAGGVAATYDYVSQTNKKYNWTNFNFSETFANPVAATNYSNAQVGFIGKDNNYWAGNYGPEITNVSFSLKYRVDPCTLNPAYSPSCSGFSSVVTSGNLVNPNLMSNGDIVYNSFAINTALKSSGAGVEVYGFNYGYNYSLGNGRSECTATNQDGSCSWYMNTNPNATMRVRLTNSSNDVIYSATQSRSTPNTAENVSYQFLLASTTNSLSLGNFTLGASTSGNAAIQNMYVNALYKPDPCATNPLYSPTCPGYATSYAKNMILGSTVASASAPAAAPTPAAATPEVVQSAPALASPDPAQPQQQAQQQPAQQAPQQQSASTVQDPNQNPVVAQDNPAQPSPQQAGPAPTSPQPAGGPPQTATASATPPSAGPQQAGPSTGGGGPSKLALSVVKTAQARDQATQQIAVQNAAKVVEGSTQQSQATATAAIAALNDMSANGAQAAAQFSSQTTQESTQAVVQQSGQSQQIQQSANTQSSQSNKVTQQVQQQVEVQQQQQTQLSQSNKVTQQVQQQVEVQQQQTQSFASMVQIQQPVYANIQQDVQSSTTNIIKPPVVSTQETAVQTGSGLGLAVRSNPIGINLSSLNNNTTQSTPAQAPAVQFRTETKVNEVEAPAIQIASFGNARAGSPLSDLMQQRFEMMQENIQQQTSTVNRNVQPNDLAGNVDIASMALQPKGFEAYNVALRDAAFYEPKEVYKGQTVVDNAKALRQLGSDRLHQEMVDQQYRR